MTIPQAILIASVLIASAGTASIPFFLAGGLKIVYDLLVYRDFRSVRPKEDGVAC